MFLKSEVRTSEMPDIVTNDPMFDNGPALLRATLKRQRVFFDMPGYYSTLPITLPPGVVPYWSGCCGSSHGAGSAHGGYTVLTNRAVDQSYVLKVSAGTGGDFGSIACPGGYIENVGIYCRPERKADGIVIEQAESFTLRNVHFDGCRVGLTLDGSRRRRLQTINCHGTQTNRCGVGVRAIGDDGAGNYSSANFNFFGHQSEYGDEIGYDLVSCGNGVNFCGCTSQGQTSIGLRASGSTRVVDYGSYWESPRHELTGGAEWHKHDGSCVATPTCDATSRIYEYGGAMFGPRPLYKGSLNPNAWGPPDYLHSYELWGHDGGAYYARGQKFTDPQGVTWECVEAGNTYDLSQGTMRWRPLGGEIRIPFGVGVKMGWPYGSYFSSAVTLVDSVRAYETEPFDAQPDLAMIRDDRQPTESEWSTLPWWRDVGRQRDIVPLRGGIVAQRVILQHDYKKSVITLHYRGLCTRGRGVAVLKVFC